MSKQEGCLSEAEIELIAERAAEKALEKVYTEIGRSVTKKILWAIGVGTLGFLTWLGGNGHLPK